MKILFGLIKIPLFIILGISAFYWISVPLGGIESVLKAIIVLCLYVAAYWYGLGFVCVPLISSVFSLFGWNKNLAFAISSFVWLGVVGLLGLKLGETEFGMWLMDT